jgi:1,4-alpha-glucan branching enzyme
MADREAVSPKEAAREGDRPAPEPVTATALVHEFRFEAAGAEEVCLVGDFNQWKVCATPLVRKKEEVWTVRIPLARGRHEYMFVVDGEWLTDPTAPFHVDDGFGNQNAVLYL